MRYFFTLATSISFNKSEIAGLLARRVVTYLETGQAVERGELVGLIKFGSRVDLYVPADYHLEVRLRQKVIDGETVLARPPD